MAESDGSRRDELLESGIDAPTLQVVESQDPEDAIRSEEPLPEAMPNVRSSSIPFA